MAVYVLYHAHCIDGSGACYAAWKKYRDNAKYIPVQYGHDFPDIKLSVEDEVYIVDFSYSKDILLQVHKQVGKLVVLDHHKSAQTILKNLDFAYFDLSKAGAILAWEYFHPNEDIPYVLKLAQDRDLWKYDYQDTHPFYEYIECYKHHNNMLEWDKLVNDNAHLEIALETGRALYTAKTVRVTHFVYRGKKIGVTNIDGKRVAVYNTTTDISDIADTALKSKELNVDYTMSYVITPKLDIIMSFRSRSADIADVSKIATSHGGGGHPTAAGAFVAYPESMEVLKKFTGKKV